jgi:hypothetical protein
MTLDEPTRSLLARSPLSLDTEVVALTIEDRERIFWALDDVRTDAVLEAVSLHLEGPPEPEGSDPGRDSMGSGSRRPLMVHPLTCLCEAGGPYLQEGI